MMTVVMGVMYLPDGRFLIARRPASKMFGGLWEFPGGKVDPDESAEQALCREFIEELGCSITIDARLDDYLYEQGETSIRFIPFTGRLDGQQPGLHEHEQIAYINVDELEHYEFAPPDYVLVGRLKPRTGP